MTEEEAWYILRSELAMAWEGIGPGNPEPDDAKIVQEAYRVAGHRLAKWQSEEIGFGS